MSDLFLGDSEVKSMLTFDAVGSAKGTQLEQGMICKNIQLRSRHGSGFVFVPLSSLVRCTKVYLEKSENFGII